MAVDLMELDFDRFRDELRKVEPRPDYYTQVLQKLSQGSKVAVIAGAVLLGLSLFLGGGGAILTRSLGRSYPLWGVAIVSCGLLGGGSLIALGTGGLALRQALVYWVEKSSNQVTGMWLDYSRSVTKISSTNSSSLEGVWYQESVNLEDSIVSADFINHKI